jgi:hypothetical protein
MLVRIGVKDKVIQFNKMETQVLDSLLKIDGKLSNAIVARSNEGLKVIAHSPQRDFFGFVDEYNKGEE